MTVIGMMPGRSAFTGRCPMPGKQPKFTGYTLSREVDGIPRAESETVVLQPRLEMKFEVGTSQALDFAGNNTVVVVDQQNGDFRSLDRIWKELQPQGVEKPQVDFSKEAVILVYQDIPRRNGRLNLGDVQTPRLVFQQLGDVLNVNLHTMYPKTALPSGIACYLAVVPKSQRVIDFMEGATDPDRSQHGNRIGKQFLGGERLFHATFLDSLNTYCSAITTVYQPAKPPGRRACSYSDTYMTQCQPDW